MTKNSQYVNSVFLSIVVPVFNEDAVLSRFHQRLLDVLNCVNRLTEIIYVDDGSSDLTAHILNDLTQQPGVGFVRFSRNFGKEQAMSAGLEIAKGTAVIIIDADLQDPPELIPKMIESWLQGADVVNMRRSNREGESLLKRFTAHCFYRFFNRVSDISMPEDVGDFRLLSRRAVNALNAMPERNRFMKGMFSWIGFKQVTLDYRREARVAGTSKWPYWKLWNLAIEGITGYSTAPLKFSLYLGFASAVSAFLYALYFVVKTLLFGDAASGFPTLIISILFFSGLQLIVLGIVGEYVARLFTESKQRPLYLIERYIPAIQEENTIQFESRSREAVQ